jgi:hypothetical protein
MAKQKQYKILSKNELAIYKKNLAIKESRRESFTNAILRAFSVIRENKISNSQRLAVKVKYLNQYSRKKKKDDIMKVVNYWMSDLSQ